MTTDQLKRLEELCEMWANPDGTAEEEMYVPVMDMLPDIIEALKSPTASAMEHAAQIAENHAVGRNCETCIAIAHFIARNIRNQAKALTPPNDSHAK